MKRPDPQRPDLKRLARLLLRPGLIVERDGAEYVLRAGPDRRRKPLARLSEADYGAAKSLNDKPQPAQSRDIAGQWQTDERGFNVQRSVNRAESPMAWLMRHKDRNGLGFLEKRHLAALEALRDDHSTGFAQPGLTSNWQAYGAGGSHRAEARRGGDLHAFRLDARRRCEEALARLGAFRAVFERVCLEGTSLGVIERGFGLPRGTAKHQVKAALDRLAAYYGY